MFKFSMIWIAWNSWHEPGNRLIRAVAWQLLWGSHTELLCKRRSRSCHLLAPPMCSGFTLQECGGHTGHPAPLVSSGLSKQLVLEHLPCVYKRFAVCYLAFVYSSKKKRWWAALVSKKYYTFSPVVKFTCEFVCNKCFYLHLSNSEKQNWPFL